tara:strand:- start:61 stop:486 length:426 start_codon:yes stop_codon:yes gene_type:complete
MSTFLLQSENNINGPVDLFHAKGTNFTTNSNLTFTSGILSAPTIEADTIMSKSDVRFKENIENLTDCLNKLLKLQSKTYNYKNKNDTHVGYIAQEVKEIFPEVVKTDDTDRLYISYIEMIPIITKAIQEMCEIIKVIGKNN